MKQAKQKNRERKISSERRGRGRDVEREKMERDGRKKEKEGERSVPEKGISGRLSTRDALLVRMLRGRKKQ